MAPKTTQRIINYFQIDAYYQSNKTYKDIIGLFTILKKQTDTKSPDRFVMNIEKRTYLNELKFEPTANQISGKLLFIRTDVFPELINMTDDAIRDIEAEADEGIIETSHFIFSYNANTLFLSLEFNQYGPKISDFVYYINHFAYNLGIVFKIDFIPIYRDDLNIYKSRMNRISFVTAKVHKDNIQRINHIDTEFGDAFKIAEKVSEAEFVTLDFKYDFKQVKGVSRIKSKVLHIIDELISDKNNTNVFETLKVRAEDDKRNNKIKEFDLLNIWVKSEVNVELKDKSRSIVSVDILLKMKKEFMQEFNR